MKMCKSCQEIKYVTEFYKRYSTVDGLYSICKTCHKAKTAARKKTHPSGRSVSVPNRCIPQWLTDGDWQEIKAMYLQATHLTEATGSRYVVDHIYPLRGMTVSGLHVPANLRVIPEQQNRKKYNKVLDSDESWV
jgi:hypothetical protein